MDIEEKLNRVAARHDELRAALAAEGGVDAQAFSKMSKELAEISPIVERIENLKKARAEMRDVAQMKDDPAADAEMRGLAEEEFYELKERIPRSSAKSRSCCCPRTRQTSATPFLRFVRERVARRRRCSPPSCCACTSASRRCMAGGSSCWR